MIELKKTSQVAHEQGCSILVYGQSGVGKTTLAKTLENPLVIAAENGLLALAGEDIDCVEIGSKAELVEVYGKLKRGEWKFDAVVIDSITEIAETILTEEKARNKDGRAAYGETMGIVPQIINTFCALPGMHKVFIGQVEQLQDETGKMLFGPSMPGRRLGARMPYLVDEVFAMRIQPDADGEPSRWLQCHPDGAWMAKDRSGKLEMWEEPDLGDLIHRIQGGE